MKHFLLLAAMSVMCCCQGHSKESAESAVADDDHTVVVEFASASKQKEQWVLQLGSPVITSIGFETNADGRCTLKLPLDTVRSAYFNHPSDGFIAQTWLQPGEKCKVSVDSKAELSQQIITTGVYSERTKASYSEEYGQFYQLLANDNFYVPLTSSEEEFAKFLLDSYSAHMDTIKSHSEWSEAMKELAVKTLNDRQYYYLTQPDIWLDLCASLRDFKGKTAPEKLSDDLRSKVYDMTIGANE